MRLSSNRHTGKFSIHHRGSPSWLPFFNVSSTYNHHRETVVDSLSQKLFGQLFLHSISGLPWPVNPDLHCRFGFSDLKNADLHCRSDFSDLKSLDLHCQSGFSDLKSPDLHCQSGFSDLKSPDLHCRSGIPDLKSPDLHCQWGGDSEFIGSKGQALRVQQLKQTLITK